MLFSGGVIPSYLVTKDLGLVNNIWVMVLPTAINTYYLIIMKNYFASLPSSLLEAAKLDGANELTVLIRIIVPISMPFMATFSCSTRWSAGTSGINRSSTSTRPSFSRFRFTCAMFLSA